MFATPDSSGPHDALPRRRASRSKALTLFVIVLNSLILIVGGWWVYPYWQKSRADGFAAEAEDFLERRNFAEAEEDVENALKVRPKDPRYLRLGARVYALQRKPEAIRYFQELLKNSEATEHDRLDLIEFSLVMGKPEVAKPLLDSMLASKNVSAQTEYLGALLAEARHDYGKALTLARSAENRESSREKRLALGRILLEAGGKENVEAGKKILFDLAAHGMRSRLEAIRALATADLSKAELEQVVRWLKVTPLPELNDLFLGYDILYRLDTNNIVELGRQVSAKFTSGRPDERFALGSWLNSHGLYEETLKAIPADSTLKNTPLAAVYLDALVGAKRWEEAMAFAEKLEGAGAKDLAARAYQRLATNGPAIAKASAALQRLGGPKGAKMGSQ